MFCVWIANCVVMERGVRENEREGVRSESDKSIEAKNEHWHEI